MAAIQFLQHELLSFMLWQVLIRQSYISPSFHSQMNQIHIALQDVVQQEWRVLHIAEFENIHQQQLLSTPNVVVAMCKQQLLSLTINFIYQYEQTWWTGRPSPVHFSCGDVSCHQQIYSPFLTL